MPGTTAQPHLSRHAAQRIAQMGVDEREVLRVARHPHSVGPGKRGHQQVRRGGDLAVVIDRDTGTVITVLWIDQFTREEAP